MAMAYDNVYVASTAMSSMSHALKAMQEADAHKGPSVVMCYTPCIEQGIRAGMRGMVQECESAVDSGYWPLYRWNPALAGEGKAPFQAVGCSNCAQTACSVWGKSMSNVGSMGPKTDKSRALQIEPKPGSCGSVCIGPRFMLVRARAQFSSLDGPNPVRNE